MRKSTKIFKKYIASFLIVLMSIESLGAIVSDNDGSAFVTKAEFETLKSNFSKQIDDYNTSIDSKIDGAIASYLSGINVLKMENITPFLSGPVYAFEASNTATGRIRYVYNPPAFIGRPRSVEFSWNPSYYGNAAVYEFRFNEEVNHNQKDWWQTKLVISDVDKTKRIASWKGRYTGAYDEIDVTYTNMALDKVNWGRPQAVTQIVKVDGGLQYNTRVLENVDLYGQGLLLAYTAPIKNSNANNVVEFYLNRTLNHWGTRHNENVILCGNSYAYDCFSNYDENRNYKYDGTSENLKQTITSHTDILRGIADGLFKGNTTLNGTFANGHTVSSRVEIGKATKSDMTTTVLGDVFYSTYRTNSYQIGDTWLWPTIGFEKTYITNWNQLYLPNLDNVAKSMVADNIKGKETLMQSADGNYHIPITAGLPLVQVKNEAHVELPFEVYTYSLDTNASSTTYGRETRTVPSRTYIWAKTSPFTTNDPNSEADINITTGGGVNRSTDTAYNKGVYITSSTATLKFDEIYEKCYIWLKWSTNNKLGNGVVIIPEQISISQ